MNCPPAQLVMGVRHPRGGGIPGGSQCGALGHSEEIQQQLVPLCAFDVASSSPGGEFGSEFCDSVCRLRDGQHGVTL